MTAFLDLIKVWRIRCDGARCSDELPDPYEDAPGLVAVEISIALDLADWLTVPVKPPVQGPDFHYCPACRRFRCIDCGRDMGRQSRSPGGWVCPICNLSRRVSARLRQEIETGALTR